MHPDVHFTPETWFELVERDIADIRRAVTMAKECLLIDTPDAELSELWRVLAVKRGSRRG